MDNSGNAGSYPLSVAIHSANLLTIQWESSTIHHVLLHESKSKPASIYYPLLYRNEDWDGEGEWEWEGEVEGPQGG
jgi:hypothetical protein